jgi:hypothetical protein
MPYWGVFCPFCNGYIADALLECLPALMKGHPAFRLLFDAKPGAAYACPYCNALIGFNDDGQPRVPEPGWPVFRYSRAELEAKRQQDGQPASMSLTDWAAGHRFMRPGTHNPLTAYTYAEQAPPDEVVP